MKAENNILFLATHDIILNALPAGQFTKLSDMHELVTDKNGLSKSQAIVKCIESQWAEVHLLRFGSELHTSIEAVINQTKLIDISRFSN